MRTTPDSITSLLPGEVFVFGSNLEGRHGAGAAKAALKFGAIMGQGFGPAGQTYAIPTKGYELETLPIEKIAEWVRVFDLYTQENPQLTFLVTKIGCGLAGYRCDEMAWLFGGMGPNVVLPLEFLYVLND
jgi:hypothetical protein